MYNVQWNCCRTGISCLLCFLSLRWYCESTLSGSNEWSRLELRISCGDETFPSSPPFSSFPFVCLSIPPSSIFLRAHPLNLVRERCKLPGVRVEPGCQIISGALWAKNRTSRDIYVEEVDSDCCIIYELIYWLLRTALWKISYFNVASISFVRLS